MKLKSIDLHGFKSFPERTRIDFNVGVTAIIGPNGSGKSNISDAVKWVLGEMSLKSLRGSKMEDVIFNGANGIAPASFASVSLNLDTSEEYAAAQNAETAPEEETARIYSLGDSPETSVTRKLYRSGESEYYINKKLVRLKDIYELFYDTGIGREGYSVIGQGKISEVLSRKDEERRSIFEEAAGISKYRYKKTETERKLRDTETNLVRVNDILGEIRQRIGPLEKESENAKKYLEFSEEKKGLEITLWLDRIDSVREKLRENETLTAAAKQQYDMLGESVAESEAKLDRALGTIQEMSKNFAEGERAVAAAENALTAAEGEISVEETEIRHLEAGKLQSQDNVKLSLASLDSLKAERKEIEEASVAAQDKLGVLKKDYDALDSEYAREKEKIAAQQERYADAGKRVDEISATVAQKRIDRAGLTASLKISGESLEAKDGALEAARESCKSLEEQGVACAEAADKAKLSVAEREKELVLAQERVTASADAAEKCRNAENAKRLALNAAEQKREALERMERLLEGYSDSVKTLLTAAKEFRLRATVYGTVSSLLSTSDDYVTAVETALGAGVQNIVVGDDKDAKSCIYYLKQNRAGRATFLPLTTITGRLADVSKLKKLDGYIGLACEVVNSDAMFRTVAEELLGRTVIAENMDSASAIARESGFRIKVVTLDGQVINPGGSYTGGSEIKKTGIMTRTLDIERLSALIRDENAALVDAEMATRRAEKECAAASENVQNVSDALSAARIESAKAESELMSVAARYAQAKTELANAQSQRDSDKGARDAAEEAAKRIDGELEQLQKQLDDASAEYASVRLDAQITDVREREILEMLSTRRLALQNAENELERCKFRMTLLEQSENGIKERIDRDNDNALRADRDIEAVRAKIEQIRTQAEENRAEIARMKADQSALNVSIAERQTAADKLRADIRVLGSDKEEAFAEYTGAKSRTDTQTAELDSVSGKLWDEYEMTYSEAEKYRLADELMDKAASRLSSLKAKIRALGVINVNAVEEYRTTKERFDFLSTQVGDLEKTRRSLDSTIEKLDATMKETFLDCFARINKAFGEVFSELFGGGSAYVCLTDPSLPLVSGIEIIVRPPGKTVKSISLLSGGEQSFAAIALYFSLQKINPAPFCIFDEIESALDEVNVNRFATYVRENSSATQYILITHRRGTMECADTLYGVTMQRKGVSEYLKVDVKSVTETTKE